MSEKTAVDALLARAMHEVLGATTPPRLRAAMKAAVFSGGGRVRPTLVLNVAKAAGAPPTPMAEASAAAVEFLHCASLVHDDLPCFDDAQTRRGKPTIHREFGEPLAVLVGDGLIVAAFEVLARAGQSDPLTLSKTVPVVAGGVSARGGIVAGQAWESEPDPDLRVYHRAKTAALFEASVCAGALASGQDSESWRPVGTLLGEAYQVADDIADQVGHAGALGKPVGQDLALGRPSVALQLGLRRAYARLESLISELLGAVPECKGRTDFRAWLATTCERFVPAPDMERAEPAAEEQSRPNAARRFVGADTLTGVR